MRLDPETIAGLDPGIRETVLWLNALGYRTCDSGDGKTKPAKGWTLEEHGVRQEPHVVCSVSPSNLVALARKLRGQLRRRGVPIVQIGVEGGAWIQASYDPCTGTGILDVMNLDDEMLRAAVKS